MKIVINRCFGGFGLSDDAMHQYLQKKQIVYEVEVDQYNRNLFCTVATNPDESDKDFIWDCNFERNDPVLVQVIEEMGPEANGACADLKVVEIPDDVEWHIAEYDGQEHVAQDHKTWC